MRNNSQKQAIQLSKNDSQQQPIYPSINLYSSSRVFNQRVNNAKIPLLKYRQAIRANNCTKGNDADVIDASLIRKLQQKDGLIYTLKNMNKDTRSTIKRMKILICVCMYNQSGDAINLTLNGIYQNLEQLRRRGIPEGDVAVVLLQDGILKLVQNRIKKTFVRNDKSMVQFYRKLDQVQGKKKCDLIQRIHIILNQIQNYDRKGMIDDVTRNRDFPPSIEKNIALVYQNLWYPAKTNLSAESKNQFHKPLQKDYNKYLRIFSCFKHTNGTKLSSHLWFFQGFCRYFKPQFCVLLDVGTTPDPDGLVNLISGFNHLSVGGVTGFMNADINFKSEQGGQQYQDNQTCLTKTVFTIQRAQQYQYIISHFIDKNQQSALGFLHVLPGAWSAYRYDALIKSQKYQPNLLQRSYFKMILNPDLQQKDYQQANMYLAQDRILSLGIYCQMDQQYILKYVPNAGARTDPMKTHENLMNQRRRWINSSLFAFLYVFKNYYFNVMDSKHNFFRKYITLNISMFLALLSTFNSYITPAIYFFVLYATINQLGFDKSNYIACVVCLVYTLVFLAGVAGALTGRQWSKNAHIISVVLSIFTFILLLLVIFNILNIVLKLFNHDKISLTGYIIIYLSIINIFCFLLILLVHLCTHPRHVWSLIVDTPSYLAYTGAYSQTMVIHAFCNVDDVSWGTKGSAGTGVSKYQTNKVFFVSTWFFCNAFLAYLFIYVDFIAKTYSGENAGILLNSNINIILVIIATYGTTTIVIKTLLAVYHHLKWLLFQNCCRILQLRKPAQLAIIDKYWKEHFDNWMKNDSNPQPQSVIYRQNKKK